MTDWPGTVWSTSLSFGVPHCGRCRPTSQSQGGEESRLTEQEDASAVRNQMIRNQMLVLSLDILYSIAMYIMFLDVTHQHSDKKWVPQSRSPKIFFAGLPPRPPPKWQLSLRHPTPDPSFSHNKINIFVLSNYIYNITVYIL